MNWHGLQGIGIELCAFIPSLALFVDLQIAIAFFFSCCNYSCSIVSLEFNPLVVFLHPLNASWIKYW
jgi:hypothetical protein